MLEVLSASDWEARAQREARPSLSASALRWQVLSNLRWAASSDDDARSVPGPVICLIVRYHMSCCLNLRRSESIFLDMRLCIRD